MSEPLGNRLELAVGVPIVLFLLCFLILLQTMVPTVFVLDSAELVAGAYTLGIVHSPGYPLYLTLLHIFMQIPVGDIAFRGNLFSALCLALTAPAVYCLLRELTDSIAASLTVSLLFMWSYYVWSIGLFAEVYASQLLTLAICGYALVRLGKRQEPTRSAAWPISVLFGVAIAMHPTSVLFAPGIFIALLLLGIPWQRSALATVMSIAIGLVSFIYLPIRFAANPPVNRVGYYNAEGILEPVNLQTLQGLFWMLSGRQFEQLFFAYGFLPTLEQMRDMIVLFAGNYLGFGLPLGLFGAYLMFSECRKCSYIWLLLFIPYTYFYTTYGVLDKQTMLGPSFLLWSIPLAVGLKAITKQLPTWLRYISLLGLPALLIVVNYPLLDLSDETSVRDESEAILEVVPEGAYIFADAGSFAPLEYLQVVEVQRSDLHLYNMYLFPSPSLQIYADKLLDDDQTVWIVGKDVEDLFPMHVLVPFEIPPSDSDSRGWDVYVLTQPPPIEQMEGEGGPFGKS